MCNMNKEDKSFQLVGDNTFNDILCPDNVMFSDLETMSWSDIKESLGLSVNPMPAEKLIKE